MHYDKKTHPHVNYISVDYDRRDYKDLWKTRWNSEKEEPIKNISELCYCIRRVVNSNSSRVQAVAKIITDHPRLIIFYNFDYELELLRN